MKYKVKAEKVSHAIHKESMACFYVPNSYCKFIRMVSTGGSGNYIVR